MTTDEMARPSSVQQPSQRRPGRRRRRAGRWLVVALLVLIGLAGAGMLYQAIGTVRDRRTSAPPGKLVDVGGSTMHLHCTGTGSPTVILEPGAGSPSPIWAWVQPEAARLTRVCSYDRAGLGWSESSARPRDAATIAQDLHTLLRDGGETGPFVLVGHSFGGQYALMFASLFGEETAGLVLIDAQHPDMMFGHPEARTMEQQQRRQVSLLAVLSRLGIVRLLGLAPADARLPAETQQALNRAKNSTAMVNALRDELEALPTNRQQLHDAGTLGNLPLFVLSATEHGTPELETYGASLQRELAALSTNSRHEIVAGADHSSLVTEQHNAHRTAAAIQAVVQRVRQQ